MLYVQNATFCRPLHIGRNDPRCKHVLAWAVIAKMELTAPVSGANLSKRVHYRTSLLSVVAVDRLQIKTLLKAP